MASPASSTFTPPRYGRWGWRRVGVPIGHAVGEGGGGEHHLDANGEALGVEVDEVAVGGHVEPGRAVEGVVVRGVGAVLGLFTLRFFLPVARER